MCNKIPSHYSGSSAALENAAAPAMPTRNARRPSRCGLCGRHLDWHLGQADREGGWSEAAPSRMASAQKFPSGEVFQADDGSDSLMAFSSVGSIGHPNLCRRPCHFHAMGHCHLGQSCTQCHEYHWSPQVLATKKQRARLRDLNEAQIWRLLWPYLEAQVWDWELAAADPRPILQLVDRRFRHLVLSGFDPIVPPRIQHQLSGVLRSMNFGCLMDIALCRLSPCPECQLSDPNSQRIGMPSQASDWLDGVSPEK